MTRRTGLPATLATICHPLAVTAGMVSRLLQAWLNAAELPPKLAYPRGCLDNVRSSLFCMRSRVFVLTLAGINTRILQ